MVDDMSTQRFPSLLIFQKASIINFSKKIFFSADILALMNGIDVVVHLAAITDAPSSFERRKEVEEVTEGTRKIAEACIET